MTFAQKVPHHLPMEPTRIPGASPPPVAAETVPATLADSPIGVVSGSAVGGKSVLVALVALVETTALVTKPEEEEGTGKGRLRVGGLGDGISSEDRGVVEEDRVAAEDVAKLDDDEFVVDGGVDVGASVAGFVGDGARVVVEVSSVVEFVPGTGTSMAPRFGGIVSLRKALAGEETAGRVAVGWPGSPAVGVGEDCGSSVLTPDASEPEAEDEDSEEDPSPVESEDSDSGPSGWDAPSASGSGSGSGACLRSRSAKR